MREFIWLLISKLGRRLFLSFFKKCREGRRLKLFQSIWWISVENFYGGVVKIFMGKLLKLLRVWPKNNRVTYSFHSLSFQPKSRNLLSGWTTKFKKDNQNSTFCVIICTDNIPYMWYPSKYRHTPKYRICISPLFNRKPHKAQNEKILTP